MIYVTDTHPLVWLLEGGPRLSKTARDAFGDAEAQIVIPAIVLVEIKFLAAYYPGR
jgi:PIN domain nuclease of toxin-antitoxin system